MKARLLTLYSEAGDRNVSSATEVRRLARNISIAT